MKNAARKALKVIKYVVFIVLGFYILDFAILGWSAQNKNDGKFLLHWTGIDSYFSEGSEQVEWIINDYRSYETEGTDGPYVFYEPNGISVSRIDSQNQLIQEKIKHTDSLLCITGPEKENHFYFRLQKEFVHSPDTASASRIMAISDIEGNFNTFSGLLKGNKVIDEQFRWTFGNGHLVLLGDFMDRGEQVTECLWLIYKLEQEAARQGGRVHYLLGNHEAMNLQGNGGYVAPKYLGLAQNLSGKKALNQSLQYLYSKDTELGRWLRSKKVVQKVNDILFVHGGLSPEILAHDLPLADINKLLMAEIDQNYYTEPSGKKNIDFLLGRKGPLWYRGLVRDYNYPKATQQELEQVLAYYNASHMVVGHSYSTRRFCKGY